MDWGALTRLAIPVLLAAAALSCSSANSAGQDLVNGGFDLAAAKGLPPGWTLDGAAAGKGALTLVDKHPGAQGRVLQLQPNAQNTGDKLLGVGQLLNAEKWRGRSIEIRARLGSAGAARAVVGVHALGKSGDLGFVQLARGDSSGQLQTERSVLVVPAAADLLVVYAIATGTTGTAFFDSVELAAASAEVLPIAAPAGSTGVLRTAVTVDVRRRLRQIPAGIYGTNAEWIFNGQGLWSEQTQALDTRAVELARELAPSVIRFPGGVFSDFYDWRHGIGPQGQRPSTLNHPGGPASRHVMGSQEVAAVAREVGAELMLTVNAGTGTARQAADWVRYAREQMQPRVRWWEVGNELYMKGDLSGGAMSADQYSRKYLAFSSAMREADPGIRVGAIGGLNFGSYRFIEDERWTEKLLRQAAPHIDFLAVHNAYAPVVMGVKEGSDPAAVYRAMLAAPKQIESNLRDLSALLAAHESPARPISIAVTEWGPFFHVLPSSPWVDHAKTMGSALFVASTLNVFIRAPRLQVANFFKLTDHGFMGWIGRRGGQWAHTAPGMVFMLYRQTLGQTLIHSEVASPAFSTPGIGAVNALDQVPWLDAIATFDQGSLVLMLVNKSDSLTLEGDVSLRGVRSFESASLRRLSADSLDAHTGTELPQLPGLRWASQIELARFSRGGAGEIRSTSGSFPAASAAPGKDAGLAYRLPPLSVTAIKLVGIGLAK